MKRLLSISALAASAAALPLSANAVDFVAYSTVNPTGTQAWVEALGMDFTVNSAITITQLGTYDSGANGITGTITVGIFNLTSGLQVGPTAAFSGFAGALVGSTDRFLDVADFTLTPGNYSVVAVGYSANDMNGNVSNGSTPSTLNTGGGLISFIGSARYNNGSPGFSLPSVIDGGPVNRYDAGTFMFTSAVPEPGTAAMMLAALGVIATVVRRRASR